MRRGVSGFLDFLVFCFSGLLPIVVFLQHLNLDLAKDAEGRLRNIEELLNPCLEAASITFFLFFKKDYSFLVKNNDIEASNIYKTRQVHQWY